MIVFSPEQINLIYADAIERYPIECCGILLGERGDGCRIVREIYRAVNAAEEKLQRNHFVIQAESIFCAERISEEKNYEIVGIYHSHIDCEATASREDKDYAIPGISYPIVSIRDGRIAELLSWEKILTEAEESFVREALEISNLG